MYLRRKEIANEYRVSTRSVDRRLALLHQCIGKTLNPDVVRKHGRAKAYLDIAYQYILDNEDEIKNGIFPQFERRLYGS